jgi:hypothetical protein
MATPRWASGTRRYSERTAPPREVSETSVFAAILFSSDSLEGRGAPFFGRLSTKSTAVARAWRAASSEKGSTEATLLRLGAYLKPSEEMKYLLAHSTRGVEAHRRPQQ